MRLLVVGLPGATVDLLLGDEGLVTLRHLMAAGAWGPLEGVAPPGPVPAWACFLTGQDPGMLGLYGPRAPSGHAPGETVVAEAGDGRAPTLGDILRQGGRRVIGPVEPREDGRPGAALAAVRARLRAEAWDACILIERDLAGPDRQQAARLVDAELGRLLEAVPADTAVLVVSPHGLAPLRGGFCLNEWLRREGFLAVPDPPRAVVPLTAAGVDWPRTRAWALGGEAGQLFLTADDGERLAAEIGARLAEARDAGGRRLDIRAEPPARLYREVRGVAPGLLVQVDAHGWRVLEALGYAGVTGTGLEEAGPSAVPTPTGVFVLAGSALAGEIAGARLLDLAPTLLELAGLPLPAPAAGASLLTGAPADAGDSGYTPEEEAIIRDRLRGLGYI